MGWRVPRRRGRSGAKEKRGGTKGKRGGTKGTRHGRVVSAYRAEAMRAQLPAFKPTSPASPTPVVVAVAAGEKEAVPVVMERAGGTEKKVPGMAELQMLTKAGRRPAAKTVPGRGRAAEGSAGRADTPRRGPDAAGHAAAGESAPVRRGGRAAACDRYSAPDRITAEIIGRATGAQGMANTAQRQAGLSASFSRRLRSATPRPS